MVTVLGRCPNVAVESPGRIASVGFQGGRPMGNTTQSRWAVAVLILVAVWGCCRRSATTADLEPDGLEWRPYIHDDLGFSLDIPESL